jgi:predicted amidophosphoribosyltransferase
MDFIRKNASEFQSGYTGYYLKPATCPHCGAALKTAAKFCSACGQKV